MIDLTDSDTFSKTQIAYCNTDHDDYSSSGWIAFAQGNDAAIGYFSHCSCYGTFDGFGGPAWEGTVDELVEMAKRTADPSMPDRKADEDDYDYPQLVKCYEAVIEWDKRGRVK